MKTKRYFIVQPIHEGDVVHELCSTTAKDDFSDIYQRDDYDVEYSTNTMKDVKNRVLKKFGLKRVTVI